jgi:hypothetical protein
MIVRENMGYRDDHSSAARRQAGLVLAGMVLFSLAGCGGNPDYAVVTGQVMLDDAPVEAAFVEFIPQDGRGSSSYGKTDSSGAFRMRKSDTQPGVHKGRCLVRIHTGDAGRSPGEQVPERIPGAYHRQSEIHCDVVNPRHAFVFELTSAGDPVTPRDVQ